MFTEFWSYRPLQRHFGRTLRSHNPDTRRIRPITALSSRQPTGTDRQPHDDRDQDDEDQQSRSQDVLPIDMRLKPTTRGPAMTSELDLDELTIVTESSLVAKARQLFVHETSRQTRRQPGWPCRITPQAQRG